MGVSFVIMTFSYAQAWMLNALSVCLGLFMFA